MVLTAREKELDKVVGLDCGADDYMVKPFGVLELSARVRSLLRRSRREDRSDELAFDGIRVNPVSYTHLDVYKRQTYKDASKAFLTMLGYADSDFTGDLASSRISKFNYLELNEKVSRQPDEVLTQTDCVNIFYNLLKAKKKDSNEIYGAVLGCELNSDGEINPITILDDERKGPILVRDVYKRQGLPRQRIPW